MKLKTLEDLEEEIILRCKWAGEEETKVAFVLHFVKQEVINWVKEPGELVEPSETRTITWIKHFFNITEEDLK